MAETLNSRPRADRGSACAPKGFRPAPATKVSAAALPSNARVKPGQWDPMPRLVEIDKESRRITAASDVLVHLGLLDVLARDDDSRADWPEGDAAIERWNAVEARLLGRLAKAPDLDVSDLHRMVHIVRSDDMLARSTYPHTKRLAALLGRVEDELIERARLPLRGNEADLIATCERFIKLDRAMNRPGHPEHAKNFHEMTDFPEWEAAFNAVEEARPRTVTGLSALARAALHTDPPDDRDIWEGDTSLRLAHTILRTLAADQGIGALGTGEVNPDAELIQICAGHAARIAAVNHGPDEEDDGPLWQAYQRSRDAIHAAVPVTMAGMVAKARAAKAEARNADGSESPSCCPAETWAWDLVNDLLRLNEGAAPSPTVDCPAAALAPQIVAASAEEIRYGLAYGTTWENRQYHRVSDQMEAFWALLAATRPVSADGALLSLIGAARLVDEVAGEELHRPDLNDRLDTARNMLAGAYYALDSLHGATTLVPLRDTYIGFSRYTLATREEFDADQARIDASIKNTSTVARS